MSSVRSASPTWLWSIWKRAVALAAPVTVEHVLRTLMRTTDVLAAGLLSPAAVAGVGIGDSFSRIGNKVGGGFGAATIALSSQDTGTEAFATRDEAIAQAFLIGFLAGVPFVLFGLLFSHFAVALLGADDEVIRLGGQYLGLIMIATPMIHVSRIGAKALQGTGDTQTPMYVRGFANVINITGTVVLAFGLGPFPRLSVVGIALATILGESAAALLFLGIIYLTSSGIQFVRPTQLTIAKQLVTISLPRMGEGAVAIIVDLPFNAVLLAISTEANAAYHIGRRVYQQILSPTSRGFRDAANILVGQSLGEDTDTAYLNGAATIALSVITAGVLSIVLFVGCGPLVRVFTNDPKTITLSIGFAQAFAVAGVFRVAHIGFKGALRGGSDTRSPFVAVVIGRTVLLLGISYLGGLYLGYGTVAVHLALVLDFGWRTLYLWIVYYRRNWIEYGMSLMEDRGSVDSSMD